LGKNSETAKNEYIVKIKNLTINYKVRTGLVKAVENISLNIPKNKVIAIIGESGCGKSTLAKSFLGILAGNVEISENSEIDYNGTNILKLSYEELRMYRWQKASMVFQAAQNALNPTLRIEEQLLDTMIDHGIKDLNKAKEKVRKLIEMVYLNPTRVLKAYPHQISGGMRQRVIIALSLVLDPEFIILDEPTTALDVITQYYIFKIFKEIHQELGLTMILITHDIISAYKIADIIVVMYGGRIMEVANVRKIFDSPKHPYTEGLLNSIPRITDKRFEIKPIPGFPPDLINKPSGCIFHPRCYKANEKCKTNEINLKEADENWLVACINQ